MKKILMQKVTDAIFEVMETMFYLTIEEKETMENDLSVMFDIQNLRACRITFSGDHSGRIYLMVPQSVLERMTQNFMGENTQVLSVEITDGSLKEALNMVAGSALTKLNKESYMRLGIPEMIEPSTLVFDRDGAIFNTGLGKMAAFAELN